MAQINAQAGEVWKTEKGLIVTLVACEDASKDVKFTPPRPEPFGVWKPDGTPWLSNSSTETRYGRLIRRIKRLPKPRLTAEQWKRVAARMNKSTVMQDARAIYDRALRRDRKAK